MINFDILKKKQPEVIIQPRDIFMSLPARDARYKYPRDVQAEVWRKWFEKRKCENCVLKMNTGSGKTVVGLIILQSCLNEGVGPAVYVVPDNYLVQQVCDEADKLRISVTKDVNDIDFLRGKSILVTNIHKLVNGKSVFGMRNNGNIDIGSIILDDVHACMDKMEKQYKICVKDEKAYKEILSLFQEDLKLQSETKFLDLQEKSNSFEAMLVPFWGWQGKYEEVYRVVSQIDDSDVMFSLPLLKESFALCNCIITNSKIEITPKFIPIHTISSFMGAKRKIFMSATLPDDSILCKDFGLCKEDVVSVVTPDRADDMGERLIMFPQAHDTSISDEDIKGKLVELAKAYNVVIITPSRWRYEFWSDIANLCLDQANIHDGVEQLKSQHVGIVVLLNKYDGVDLPDDACRVLVIDGLPSMHSEFDGYERNIYPASQRLRCGQIQKIEQGMGRGVRSNTDYCVVILLGKVLAETIYASKGIQYFSQATRAQFELSENMCSQVKENFLDNIVELSNYSLLRNDDWMKVSKDALSGVLYDSSLNIDDTVSVMRRAYDLAESREYNSAEKLLTEESNRVCVEELKGMLKQYAAEYINFVEPVKAQQILRSAKKFNRKLLNPIQGIRYDKDLIKLTDQAEELISYNKGKGWNPNTYKIKVEGVLSALEFQNKKATDFEAALKDISFLIGIESERPENESGRGPDNCWILGNKECLVIECKNEATRQTICKHDCNQLNGSINWFDSLYKSKGCSCVPIMVHNSKTFAHDCAPDTRIRIMTPRLLDKFKEAVRGFSLALTHEKNFSDSSKVRTLLKKFNLQGEQIVSEYTEPFRIASSN